MATISDALNAAVKLHQAGNLDGAERIYREILQADPKQPDAWHLLGLVRFHHRDLDAAREHIGRAIELDADQASYHNHLGEVHRALRQWSQAEACCRKAIELKADFSIAHNTLGAVLADQRKFANAADCYREAVKYQPEFAQAHLNLATALHYLERLDEAVDYYRRALQLDPGLISAEKNLGAIYQSQSKWDEAKACYLRALAADPNCAESHFNLGLIFHTQGNAAQAIESYRSAVRRDPHHAGAYNNLGAILRRQGKLAEAVECYEQALEYHPNFGEALNNLGNVFQMQGRNVEALVCFEQTLRIEPDHAQARYNRSRMLLAAGDFEQGWGEYEWRLRCADLEKQTFVAPRWRGEPLEGRTLLVHAEQGLGDTLQFIRYVPLLSQFGGTVIVQVPKALVAMFEQSSIPGLVAKGAPLGKFDVQIPLMSLPSIFGTKLETIPNCVPYLAADPRLVDQWRENLASDRFQIGICWQGSPSYFQDIFRSIPLVEFSGLDRDGVQLVNLQKGFGAEQLTGLAGPLRVRQIDHLDERHGPFMDTAAVIKNLDLVISADTVIGHLAGALGANVWLALPYSADWRWLCDRDDSPWYPTMRLFRQPRLGDWPDVFRRIAGALEQQLAERWRNLR